MAEEPSLPRFPSVSWNSGTQSFNNTRKRVRGDGHESAAESQLFANSSDPAMFSSDDDPHLENYTQGGRHRKKRYVGSWFQQQPASGDSAFSEENKQPRPKGKRTFERTFDSGVWMGSDGSTDLELEEPLGLPTTPRLPQLIVSRQTAGRPAAEELARDKIFDAIDNGKEDIDLTSMNIEQLSNATIAPLSELTCIPLVTAGVPFEQKDPSLKIYLSQNPLIKVPGAVFNLEFLTYLSLRNTKITEIPPAVGRLQNLQTLNVSMNRLRWLPGELLDLLTYPSKLKELMIDPNPFHLPNEEGELDSEIENEWKGLENALVLNEEPLGHGTTVRKLWLDRQDALKDDTEYPAFNTKRKWIWQAAIRARTPMQFDDSRGIVTSNFSIPGKLNPGTTLETEDLGQPPRTPLTRASSTARNSSRVPSLLELALKACSRTSQLPHLPSYLPEDVPKHLPDLLHRILAQADANANAGDLPCSKCRRRVIVPVAQWIEWWHLWKVNLPTDTVKELQSFDSNGIIPFLKRACSYRCLPEGMSMGTLLPGTLRCSLVRSEDS
ncbi:hypothetical protein SUNI508_13918 [Seiridium unicorne]|uniref:Uncharacterized protein n=1 Tax=Seiridium unicorne TaxID=138068 RepID=A0ABR2V9Z1_9PEZI